MGSRQKAGVEGVGLRDFSRRSLIAGTSAAAFGVATPAAPAAPSTNLSPAVEVASDEGARHWKNWLAVNAKIEHLQSRWSKLEGWLGREHSWFDLSPAEQQALPWANELRDIDGCLGLLFERRDKLLEKVPICSAITIGSVINRLAVVERLIEAKSHSEAHALLVKSRQDLIVMSREGFTGASVRTVCAR